MTVSLSVANEIPDLIWQEGSVQPIESSSNLVDSISSAEGAMVQNNSSDNFDSAVASTRRLPDFATRNVFDREPTFDLGHRIYRLLWQVSWLILARWTPPAAHRWRIALANLFGAKIHSTVALYPSVRLWYPRHLTMAERSTLAPDVICYSVAPITLAPYAIVSQGAHLCTASHDIDDPRFQLVAEPIDIGRHAWVCAEAFVGPGVTLGEGAVLGARGAAFRNLDAWTVYGGVPARFVGCRRKFERETIGAKAKRT